MASNPYQNGQRGPNVAEFIANLNAIPTAQDLAAQQQQDFNFDDDLAMFTNATFFDFDIGQDADLQPATLGFDGQQRGGDAQLQSTQNMAKANMDFLQGDFAFPDFSSFSQQHQHPNDGYAVNGGQHSNGQQHQQLYPASGDSSSSPPSGLTSPQNGEKRKASDALLDGNGAYSAGFEDSSRVAAEEDKRRRNTAASARFRVKKKQREQALEKSAREMSDKVSALEGRIGQLETENKWLKNLVMEKNDDKEDLAALWRKYSQETADRKGDARRKGVGTSESSA
ncbi:hypothetical protein V502_10317 [Pseudogymnoascus sp. VKM F-4520 (FW-2644)]|nr:hypothetical protein V502_10317 [Pseudogymnoascus sp. VKM F-4520 (FW-2644)]